MDDIDDDDFPGEYDPETDTYRVFYNPDTLESVTTVISKTAAALTDTRPTDLDPLYDALNPDALNRLYSYDPQQESAASDNHVAFMYNGCRVRVFSTGVIEVDSPADS